MLNIINFSFFLIKELIMPIIIFILFIIALILIADDIVSKINKKR